MNGILFLQVHKEHYRGSKPMRFCYLIILLLFGTSGCIQHDPSQQCWHERLGNGQNVVIEGADNGRRVSADELKAWLGPPDFIFSGSDIISEISKSFPHISKDDAMKIVEQLKSDYAFRFPRAAIGEGPGSGTSKGDRTTAAERKGDVGAAVFWVWSERRHFHQPFSSYFGFFDEWFMIDDGQVVAIDTVSHG